MNAYQLTPDQRVAYCGQLIAIMREMVIPSKPVTSKSWNPDRAKRINDIAQSIRVTGGRTAPEN